ncbi:hypothetical protein Q9R32_08045, partial [Actinotalea sp. AC32]|nr:hypothetical protein [Actinotalea sp. AC32]
MTDTWTPTSPATGADALEAPRDGAAPTSARVDRLFLAGREVPATGPRELRRTEPVDGGSGTVLVPATDDEVA